MTGTIPPSVQAAVLVPVFRREDGELRVVLVRRGDRGVHGGQLAFPGGKCEPGDSSPLAAALREADEEVGLAAGQVRILAPLPATDTFTTGYLIFPFLARIDPPRVWRIQSGEIAEVIEAKVRDFSQPGARGTGVERIPPSSEPEEIAFYRVGPHRLWGATYRILEPLVPRLLAGEWLI